MTIQRRCVLRAAARPVLLVPLLLALAACAGEYGDEVATADRSRPEGVSPLFQPLPEQPPEPEDNPTTPERVELGHKLFFEPKLPRSGLISCNPCQVVRATGVAARALAYR